MISELTALDASAGVHDSYSSIVGIAEDQNLSSPYLDVISPDIGHDAPIVNTAEESCPREVSFSDDDIKEGRNADHDPLGTSFQHPTRISSLVLCDSSDVGCYGTIGITKPPYQKSDPPGDQSSTRLLSFSSTDPPGTNLSQTFEELFRQDDDGSCAVSNDGELPASDATAVSVLEEEIEAEHFGSNEVEHSPAREYSGSFIETVVEYGKNGSNHEKYVDRVCDIPLQEETHKEQRPNLPVLTFRQTQNLHRKLDRLRKLWAKQDFEDQGLYWMILTSPTMKIIVDHVPTTKKELAACFNILEQKYDEIMDEYGDRLIDAICQFLGEENLTEYVATTKKNAPIKPFYETKKLTKKLEHLAKTWAKEEQDIGNPVSDWDILSPSLIKTIAEAMPTTKEQLDSILMDGGRARNDEEENDPCGSHQYTGLLDDEGKARVLKEICMFIEFESLKKKDLDNRKESTCQKRKERRSMLRWHRSGMITTRRFLFANAISTSISGSSSFSNHLLQPTTAKDGEPEVVGDGLGAGCGRNQQQIGTLSVPRRTHSLNRVRRLRMMMMNSRRGFLSFRSA